MMGGARIPSQGLPLFVAAMAIQSRLLPESFFKDWRECPECDLVLEWPVQDGVRFGWINWRFERPKEVNMVTSHTIPDGATPPAKSAATNRLQEWRLKTRLSQGEVATLMHLSVATINRHESGVRGLTHEQIMAYARLYKIPTYALFYRPFNSVDPDPTEGGLEPDIPYGEYQGGFNAEKHMGIAR